MITRLAVLNFQSLEDVRLDLGRFTVVVGASNSGKSAIRRAIEALVRNDAPAGRLRTGAKAMAVAMVVDGVDVTWRKTPKTTIYEVDELEIAKPGATTPPPVLEQLRMGDVNFASQFDRPYLLAETPSAVAKALGELTNVAVLFAGIREATRRQRAAQVKGTTLTAEQVRLTERLESFGDLPAEKAALDVAYSSLVAAQESEQTASALTGALGSALAHTAAMEGAAATLASLPPTDDALELLSRAEGLFADVQRIDAVRRRAVDLQAIRDAAVRELPAFDAALAVELDRIDVAVSILKTLDNAWGWARSHESDLARAHADLAALDQYEAAANAELATIDTCPLCGQSTQGVLTRCA